MIRARYGAFTAGAACPAKASGDSFLIDGQSNPSTFLAHAVEVILDGVGDDDGRCESQEVCIFSPNLGAYQGEGALSQPCTFSDGQVAGVELKAHADVAP